MRVRIWGCRGSVAAPGRATVRCGGKRRASRSRSTTAPSSCSTPGPASASSARAGERGVAAAEPPAHAPAPRPPRGARFFAPLFDPETTIHIWGPPLAGPDAQGAHRTYFSPPLFPIDLSTPGEVVFHDRRRAVERSGRAAHREPSSIPGPRRATGSRRTRRRVAYIPDHEPALGGDSAASRTMDLGRLDLAEASTYCSTTRSTPTRSTRTPRLGPLEREGAVDVRATRSGPGGSSCSTTTRPTRTRSWSSSKRRPGRSSRRRRIRRS